METYGEIEMTQCARGLQINVPTSSSAALIIKKKFALNLYNCMVTEVLLLAVCIPYLLVRDIRFQPKEKRTKSELTQNSASWFET